MKIHVLHAYNWSSLYKKGTERVDGQHSTLSWILRSSTPLGQGFPGQPYPQGWVLGVSPSGPGIPHSETGHQHPHPRATHTHTRAHAHTNTPHTVISLSFFLPSLTFPSADAVTGRAVATGMRRPQTPSSLTGTGQGRRAWQLARSGQAGTSHRAQWLPPPFGGSEQEKRSPE